MDDTRSLMSHLVCDDIAIFIVEIVASMRIQKYVRRFFLKHTRRHEWFQLRRMIMTSTHMLKMFDTLNACSWVRREWNQEPMSWIYMLTHERAHLWYIFNEIKCLK